MHMEKKELSAQQVRRMKRSNIVKGTLILTLAGFITRFIGFFYRIFLSQTMGAELMGIYQLIFPVYGICYTIYAAGIQTSISRLVAAELAKSNIKNEYRILRVGMLLSVGLAALLSVVVFMKADMIAWRFLLQPRCAESIRILAVTFPFCGVTACINGFYYGLKKTGIPASTQLLEQAVRVLTVYLIASFLGTGDGRVTVELAVFGLVIGEVASSLYNFISLFLNRSTSNLLITGPDPNAVLSRQKLIIRNLLVLSVPLSANRLLLSILHSIEAVMIPAMLIRSGLNSQEALTVFGVLNGMSIPFIMFPTALTNALAVLLLPTVSEAQAVSNNNLIGKTTAISIKYSLIIGIISTGLFIIFGKDLGNAVFHNEASGDYLMILAWLCPFMYLATTLGSIINGLGKAHITFINSIIGSLCKILLVIILIPARGITGYLIALLIGQLIITGLDTFAVIKNVTFKLDSLASIVTPAVVTAFAGFLLNACYEYIKKTMHLGGVIFLLTSCLIMCIICIGLLLITGSISRKDFR